MKYLAVANFHIFVGQPPRRAEFTKGMVIEAAHVPADQSAEAWEAAGLVKKVDPLDHDANGTKGGSLPKGKAA